jgi:hypothetical protein
LVAAKQIREGKVRARVVSYDVRIPSPISREQAQLIATSYARSRGTEAEPFRVFFHLPGQVVSSGANVIVEFGRDVNVVMQGPSMRDIETTWNAMPEVDGELIGEWLDYATQTGGRVRIVRRRGRYVHERMFFGTTKFTWTIPLRLVTTKLRMTFEGQDRSQRFRFDAARDGGLDFRSGLTGGVIATGLPLAALTP